MQTPLSRGALLKRVKSGELTIGTFLGLASPIAAEVASIGGVDWVLLDLEHGGGSESLVGATVISSGAYGVPTLVRVESSERIRIGRVLDEGVAGVMVPRLNSAAEVAEVTKHFAYPPLGDRGAATYNRASRWGEDLDALDPAPKAACIIQIETKGALDDVEAIAALPGVDILFVGPLDLSFALGMPRDFDNPTFQQALARVVEAAKANGKVAGIITPDAKGARRCIELGFGFIALGSDATLMEKTISDAVKEIKG